MLTRCFPRRLGLHGWLWAVPVVLATRVGRMEGSPKIIGLASAAGRGMI